MTFKQATEVFRTAGRPVTLTMSLPDQRTSQPQNSATQQAQSALEKLQVQAALIEKSNAGHAVGAPEDTSGGDGPMPAGVEEGLPPAQPSVDPDPLVVSCPEGVCEGHRLIVTAPDGRELEIVVPAGVFSGDEFEIQIGE